MGIALGHVLRTAVTSLLFAALGMALFGLAFWLIARALPFSLRKELEDDQNTAIGIVLGAVIIGIAMIVSAAVQG